MLAVLALHLPGPAAFAWFRGVGGLMVGGQPAGLVVLLLLGFTSATRSPAPAPSG